MEITTSFEVMTSLPVKTLRQKHILHILVVYFKMDELFQQ